jgi:thiosulfate reductase cytochrome b subunit
MHYRQSTVRAAHPLPVQITHWTGAGAMSCMMPSGWQIYNASPARTWIKRLPARSEWHRVFEAALTVLRSDQAISPGSYRRSNANHSTKEMLQ